MSKQRKVTIKFFLNKALKPQEALDKDDNVVNLYPLYFQVTYMRKNTQIKSAYGSYYESIEKVENALLKSEEATIRKIVDYLFMEQGEKFTLKGLGKYYEIYSLPVYTLLNRHMIQNLQAIILNCSPQEYAFTLNLFDPEARFEILFEVAKRVFDDFEENISDTFAWKVIVFNEYIKFDVNTLFGYNFHSSIERFDGSLTKEYKAHLQKVFKYDDNKIDARLNLITEIIDQQLNQYNLIGY